MGRPTIILNETQRTVLLKIGLSRGSNAFAIAKELGRDQSGINRICKGLRKSSFVDATKTLNVKNAPVIELRLTLLGFAFVVRQLYLDNIYVLDPRVMSLLQSNRDLHEGIDIFAEYFAFAIETGQRSDMTLYHLVSIFGDRRTSGRDLTDFSSMWGWTAPRVHRALYVDLFFNFWDATTRYMIFSPEESEFFETKIIQRFKDSKGWDLILEELEAREDECARLKTLRSLIQQKD